MQVLFFLGCVAAVPLGIMAHQFGRVPAAAKKNTQIGKQQEAESNAHKSK
jgi:hypothetical protein